MSDSAIVKTWAIIGPAVVLLTAALVVPLSIGNHLNQQQKAPQIAACARLAPNFQLQCVEGVVGVP